MINQISGIDIVYLFFNHLFYTGIKRFKEMHMQKYINVKRSVAFRYYKLLFVLLFMFSQ